FIDTAGIDDTGALGELRIKKTRSIFNRTDLGIIVTEAESYGDFETKLILELNERNIPLVIVFNKADLNAPEPKLRELLLQQNIPCVSTVAVTNQGILDLRQALLDAVPPEMLQTPNLLGDIVGKGELVLIVVPTDKEAPKGRLIVPQQQTLRNLLDNDALCMVAKEHELATAFARLTQPPKLVITDSQAFKHVAAVTPPEVLLTSFSILFARLQGDLTHMVKNTETISALQTGDTILIAEACTHHPIEDDIGREKIPNWLRRHTGSTLNFHHVQGHDFPDDLSEYKLIIHCGACMFNRRAMLTRLRACQTAGVPLTNYGLTIAYCLGIFERALSPFPLALKALTQHNNVSPKVKTPAVRNYA
ncbi:MAG: [FeFe] hydrogenase H-cluster maturation GTPase HydF, partial [Deltaproteobacteria bacterium]|nr:[FeFe] hydrogenase H-cluster maturation GTPase HydF [Deltaproteobacteria bacterium]